MEELPDSPQQNRFTQHLPKLGIIFLVVGIGGYAPTDFLWDSKETLFLIFIALAGFCLSLKPARPMPRPTIILLSVPVLLTLLFSILGLHSEKESAFAALPYLFALVTVFFCAQRIEQKNLPLILFCIFLLSSLSFVSIGHRETALWFVGAFVWLLGVQIFKKYKLFSSSNTLRWGTFFFVLLVVSIKILDSFIASSITYHSADTDAAFELFFQSPLLGVGLGGADSAFLSFSERAPELGLFAPLSVFRLLTEVGVISILILLSGLYHFVISGLNQLLAKKINSLQANVYIIIVILIYALLNSHEPPYSFILFIIFLIPLSTTSSESTISSVHKKGIILTSIILLLITLYFPFTIALWKRNQPPEPLTKPPFIYTYWSKPHQDRSWWIREKSPELIKFTDPRFYLKESTEDWLWRTPHNELALVEWVRVQHRSLPIEQVEPITLEAYQKNPWYDPLALWHVRVLTEQNKIREAHSFLTAHVKRQATINPVLLNRLSELSNALQEQAP